MTEDTRRKKLGRPFKPWPTARLEAKAAGKTRYFDATPCNVRGHVSERWTSNNGCCACFNEKRGHPYSGPRVNADPMTMIESAESSEMRQLANLKQRITDMQRAVTQKYAALRVSLAKSQMEKFS